VLLFVVAVPVFGVHVYASTLPAAVVTLVLGAACLASVGLAVATLAKNADQATPIAQVTFLPVSFISGIWFPLEGAPDWLTTVANVFPLAHIVRAFDRCFSPGVGGGGWSPDDLWSIAVWTVIALFVATRRFDAEPAAQDRGTGRRGVLRRVNAGS
jgi:ABC-2 type transport system permease protein